MGIGHLLKQANVMMVYYKIYYEFGGWEYYRRRVDRCEEFWSISNKCWLKSVYSGLSLREPVSEFEVLVVCGPEAINNKCGTLTGEDE